jgi:hypothetical protein
MLILQWYTEQGSWVQYNNAVRGHGRHSGQLMCTFLCKGQHIPVQSPVHPDKF